MCSLNDECYKQLKKCMPSCVQQKPKKRMTGELAASGAIVVLLSVFD